MMATEAERQWYALQLRSNFERKAHGYCVGRGLTTFLPTYRRRSRKHGGPKHIDRPLFPGYLFAHIDLGLPEKNELLSTPGSVALVRFGNRAVPIPDSEIESIRIVSQPGSDVQPHPFLREGMKVAVIAGPFTGAQGILVKSEKRKTTFVVTIELLGRSVGVPIELDMIEPVL